MNLTAQIVHDKIVLKKQFMNTYWSDRDFQKRSINCLILFTSIKSSILFFFFKSTLKI